MPFKKSFTEDKVWMLVENTKMFPLNHSGMGLEIVGESKSHSPRSNEYFKSIVVSRPYKEVWSPALYVELIAYALHIAIEDIPYTYMDANSKSSKWILEIRNMEEMNSFHKNKIRKLVLLPPKKKVVGCK